MQYREALHIPADLLCTIRDDMVKQVGNCCVQVVPAPTLFVRYATTRFPCLLQMNATLSGTEHSPLLMLPSMVDELPNGCVLCMTHAY